jgi:hypothetical protein
VLPDRERAGLVRGLPRLGRVAAEVAGLVDHGGEPGRVGRVRVLRRGQLRPSGDHPDAERPRGQPRHVHRRGVLPHRRGAPAVRADRAGPSFPALTARGTSSGRSGPSRSCGGGSRCPG